ncbi:MAG: UDP-N-acetylmuramoyl-tripeptide--D-alanyl-D-alanine ligase [Pseudomonadota bacterium]
MSETLWTAEDAAAATGGRATAPFAASGVSIDTRSIAPGDLFVALKDARDGHDFVGAAFESGASAALVTHRPEGVAKDKPLLILDDVLKGLERLGAAARARSNAVVIGVTGSVGKTGVKEMLRATLGASGLTHAPEKSFNNHWGVPLTLARMPQSAEYAAIEMGMNARDEIRPLSRLARPHIAIITTVAPVHMAAFASETDIAFAKSEILQGLEGPSVAILNRDNPHFERLRDVAGTKGARVIGFGENDRADARLTECRIKGTSTVVKATLHGRELIFKIGAPGRHLAMNAMAVLAAVDAAGADLAKATMALSSWAAPDGRGSRWRIALGEAGIDGGIELIDESYNANPTSARAALEVLAAAEPISDVGRIAKGRRIAFLGDMLELGPEETAMHAGLAKAEEAAGVDLIHTCGPRMKALHEALPTSKRGEWREDSAKLAADIPRLLDAGDVAMVKGSLGARMAKVVDAIRGMGEPRRMEEETTDAL